MFKVVVVVFLIASCTAGATKIIGIDDLNAVEKVNLRKLAPAYLQISKDLCDMLQDNLEVRMDPEKIVKFAKEEMGKPNRVFGDLSISWTVGVNTVKKRARREALNLFISLEHSLDDCKADSYEILARNVFMHELLDTKFWSFMTNNVLMHYMRKHAEMCRPVHKKRFAGRVKDVPEDVLAKLEKAFNSIDISHFGWTDSNISEHFNLVGMPRPVMTEPSSHGAIQLIARNLKPNKTGQTHQFVEDLKDFFDQELFEPCEVFQKELDTILGLARIDASSSTVADEKSLDKLFWSDKTFYRALISNRLCGCLLAERDELYSPLTVAYNEWKE